MCLLFGYRLMLAFIWERRTNLCESVVSVTFSSRLDSPSRSLTRSDGKSGSGSSETLFEVVAAWSLRIAVISMSQLGHFTKERRYVKARRKSTSTRKKIWLD
jgi:hypothetical protein